MPVRQLRDGAGHSVDLGVEVASVLGLLAADQAQAVGRSSSLGVARARDGVSWRWWPSGVPPRCGWLG